MGKIRIKALGDEKKEKKQKQKDEARREGKKTLKQKVAGEEVSGVKAKTKEVVEKKVEAISETEETVETPREVKKAVKTANYVSQHKRGRRYQQIRAYVDRTKLYSVSEAMEMLKKMKISSFDETVEVNVNTTEKGLKGSFSYPHETGKVTRIVVCDDKILKEVEGGSINFEVLIAHPSFMPKLAKLAKILGPKGLMPNPKNGTISEKPEETALKLAGSANFKTEPNFPIVHTTIGKISFPEKNLEENFQALIKAIGSLKIVSVFIKTSMGPSVRIGVVQETTDTG